MTYSVRPIDTWPGPRSHRHRMSQFSASYSATERLLAAELGHLAARNVVLMIDVSESDIRLDGLLRASARPDYPGVIVAFDSRYGPLKYMSDTFTRWQDNVRAIALGLEALRKVDRYGITKRGEQYTGWRQLTAGGNGMTPAEAAALIGRHGGTVRQARPAGPRRPRGRRMTDIANHRPPPRRDPDLETSHVGYALASMRNYAAMAWHQGATEDAIYQVIVDQLHTLQHPNQEDTRDPDH
jgi:hypothetical protein